LLPFLGHSVYGVGGALNYSLSLPGPMTLSDSILRYTSWPTLF